MERSLWATASPSFKKILVVSLGFTIARSINMLSLLLKLRVSNCHVAIWDAAKYSVLVVVIFVTCIMTINAHFQSDSSIVDLADTITKRKFKACFQGYSIILWACLQFWILMQLKLLWRKWYASSGLNVLAYPNFVNVLSISLLY
jgi:hypothetical protein